MCGIFAYMGHIPLPILEVLKVLHILESEQEPDEMSPVGGHGAGIAYFNQKGTLALTKVGKTNNISPVNDLQLQLGETANNSSRLILGHVRRASPEFLNTIQHKKCTQPYKPNCTHQTLGFTMLTAHNGYAQNYQQLKNTLKQPHQYESQKNTLIDSEVIAHLTEENLTKTRNPTKTTHTINQQVKGNNTIVTLYIIKNQAYLHAIQKGKTRGLTAWTNPKGEALICTREKPATKVLNRFLAENKFQKIIHICHKDSANLEAHFHLRFTMTTQKHPTNHQEIN